MSINQNHLHDWQKFQEHEAIRGAWKEIQDGVRAGREHPLLYHPIHESEKRAVHALKEHIEARQHLSWLARIFSDGRLIKKLQRTVRLAEEEMNDDYNRARGIASMYPHMIDLEHDIAYCFKQIIRETLWPPATIRSFRQKRDFVQRFKLPESGAVRWPADESRGYLSPTDIRALVNGIHAYYAVRASAAGLLLVCILGSVLLFVIHRLS